MFSLQKIVSITTIARNNCIYSVAFISVTQIKGRTAHYATCRLVCDDPKSRLAIHYNTQALLISNILANKESNETCAST